MTVGAAGVVNLPLRREKARPLAPTAHHLLATWYDVSIGGVVERGKGWVSRPRYDFGGIGVMEPAGWLSSNSSSPWPAVVQVLLGLAVVLVGLFVARQGRGDVGEELSGGLGFALVGFGILIEFVGLLQFSRFLLRPPW